MADLMSVSSIGGSSTGEKTASAEGYSDRGAPIPEGYGETRVVLLPRDPAWMFAYWEISEGTARDIKSKHGEDIFVQSQPVLRMHEVDGDGKSVRTLRFLDVPVVLDARNWYLHADKEGSSWFVELGLKTAGGEFICIAKSNCIKLPRGRVSELTDERWVTVREDLEKLLAASGGGKVGMGSLELARMLAQRWEMLSQVSSWKGSGGVSSFGRPTQEQMAGRKFWLVADCEVILYGATETTATVTVAGRPVELFPDGTFSLRFALPDGQLDLPVKAISGDRLEERTIRITVDRNTSKS